MTTKLTLPGRYEVLQAHYGKCVLNDCPICLAYLTQELAHQRNKLASLTGQESLTIVEADGQETKVTN